MLAAILFLKGRVKASYVNNKIPYREEPRHLWRGSSIGFLGISFYLQPPLFLLLSSPMEKLVLNPQSDISTPDSELPTPNSLTPAMRQYMEIKETCRDAVLFFRMGDFYEMFFEDAKLASRILNIALTTRDRNRENAIPMCGIPYHAANSYIAKLVKEGHKVAVCEQVEDPREAKGIVKREVTKVITPGVVLEEELLDAKTNNFIASATWNGNTGGLSYMDVTTGEFKVTEFSKKTALMDEIKRIEPKELLITEELANGNNFPEVSKILANTRVTSLRGYNFRYDDAVHGLTGHFQVLSLDGLGRSE